MSSPQPLFQFLDHLIPIPPPNSDRPFSLKIDFGDSLWTDTTDFQNPSDLLHDIGISPSNDFQILPGLTKSQKIRLTQQWLFWGLLSTLLGNTVQRNVVIDASNQLGGPQFPLLLQRWQKNIDIRNVEMTLEFAATKIDQLDWCGSQNDDGGDDDLNELLAATILCVKLLIEYFASILDTKPPSDHYLSFSNSLKVASNAPHQWPKEVNVGRSGPKKWFRAQSPGSNTSSSRVGLLLTKWFEKNGWCSVVAKSICQDFDCSIAYYLLRIRRHEAPKVHLKCKGSPVCSAYNLKGRERQFYKPKHMDDCSDCQCLPASISNFEEQLCKIIENGQIPILSMDPKAEDLDIRIEVYNGVQSYTAVSHVWSDGMGNDRHNQVHKCQLQSIAQQLTMLREEKFRLMGVVERFYSGYLFKLLFMSPKLYFWLDTVCIPARAPDEQPEPNETQQASSIESAYSQGANSDPSSDNESTDSENEGYTTQERPISRTQERRNQAVRHITPIFQAAEQILVLDKELENIVEASDDQLSATLFSCKWAQRAWTFQEGSSARDCRFKIKNRPPAMLRNLMAPEAPVWLLGRAYDFQIEQQTAQGQIRILKRLVQDVCRFFTGKPIRGKQVSQFLVPLRSYHAGLLNDVRKMAVRSGRRAQDKKTYNASDADLVTHIHNNLAHRSATRPEDQLQIAANLLDRDSYYLSTMDNDRERFSALLYSCQQIPLSLLFNTRISLYKDVNLERLDLSSSWIPTRFEGDSLVSGPVLVNESSNKRLRIEEGRFADNLDFIETSAITDYGAFDGKALERLLIKPGDEQYTIELFLPHQRLKRKRWLKYLPDGSQQIAYGPRVTDKDKKQVFDNAKQKYNSGTKTLYVIDKSTGTESIHGYRGRGARLTVIREDERDVRLQYDCPLIIWTQQQWVVRYPDVQNLGIEVPALRMKPGRRSKALYLSSVDGHVTASS
ncbi:hypothetical protein MMC28_010983 [Mycoblastus sanguinarius]|nr:hypothetical protein [Mycoblastus sanguinarius]